MYRRLKPFLIWMLRIEFGLLRALSVLRVVRGLSALKKHMWGHSKHAAAVTLPPIGETLVGTGVTPENGAEPGMATLGVTGGQNLASPQLRVWREVYTWARTPHLFGNNLGLEGHWLHPWVRARHPSLPALACPSWRPPLAMCFVL